MSKIPVGDAALGVPQGKIVPHILRVALAERSYDVRIARGLLSMAGEAIRELHLGLRAFFLTDSNVGPLYADKLSTSLREAGYRVSSLTLPAGERTKSFASLTEIYDALLEAGLTRDDVFVTLGGGVIGDLGGFAAATYMRGLPLVHIPTSLLAQVDSSLGGKVAVDLPQGKNLVGSFYQPLLVLTDPTLPRTLTDYYFGDGLAEVIKAACLADKDFFAKLSRWPTRPELEDHLAEIVIAAGAIKKNIVEKDERDHGVRMLLNFGHTLGHALEKALSFTIGHGQAVSIGMNLITRLSESRGLTQKGTSAALREILEVHGLPLELPASAPAADILAALGADKKKTGDSLRVVLLREIGSAYCQTVANDFFCEALYE